MSEGMSLADEARQVLLQEYYGVLSTVSVEVEGYPFGSVTPYCLDRAGRPVILISRIAQHTKNIWANSKVSLIILQKGSDDVQAEGRLTVVGDAEKITAAEEIDDIAERYYRAFPQAVDYHKTHDFDFYRINPVKLRFIGGFGKIRWLEPEKFLKVNPFTREQEAGIVNHMNEDHADAIVKYCLDAGFEVKPDVKPVLTGIDAEGIHILLGQRVIRIAFSRQIENSKQAREILVEMVRGTAASH
ncbi:MAG TPA: DUF2470 domain-containing protein [Pseudomonadales bacterium]|nr:DUF2470 domain-containing protein [Pseudomonadales bacterium]